MSPEALNECCPDCNSDARLEEIHPGVWALIIRHDETCPLLRQMEVS